MTNQSPEPETRNPENEILFLGAGAMGEALIRGLLRAGVYEPSAILAFDADHTKTQSLADELGITFVSEVEEAAREAEIVLLAVKPQIVEKALVPLRGVLRSQQTLISIAAGVSISQLEAMLEGEVPIVRVMPNTPCLVGRAASAICLSTLAGQKQREQAHQIFGAVGVAVDVEEKLMDAVTGVSGSGPAYVYLFIEALADGGVKAGLPRATAQQLAAQTVLGAAQMVLDTGLHPGALKDMVASPGGTTIAALHALEQSGFRAATMNAVEAAATRSAEMQKNSGK